jgi:hypothetical protein
MLLRPIFFCTAGHNPLDVAASSSRASPMLHARNSVQVFCRGYAARRPMARFFERDAVGAGTGCPGYQE